MPKKPNESEILNNIENSNEGAIKQKRLPVEVFSWYSLLRIV